jgi:hypothetical protein
MKPVARILDVLLVAVWVALAASFAAAAAQTAAEPLPANDGAAAIVEDAEDVKQYEGAQQADPPWVEREIARTDRLLERIRDKAPKPAPPHLRRAFDEAAETQERAKRQFERGEFGRALVLTRQARREAARLAEGAARSFDPEHVARALRLTDAFVEEAGAAARRFDSDPLANRVGEAERLQARAHEQFARRHYGEAYRLSLEAREVLKNAVGARRPEFDDDGVRSELVKTDEEIRRVRDAVTESPAKAAKDAFERAAAEQDTAWREFERRRLLAALAHTRISRSLLRQALDAKD